MPGYAQQLRNLSLRERERESESRVSGLGFRV